MITNHDTLYNRHILSKHQIGLHFGKVDDQAISEPTETFQSAETFLKIVDVLQQENLRFIPFKGPVLGQTIYGDIRARRFYDLDFFVNREDVFRFSEILRDLGFRPAGKQISSESDILKLFQKTNQLLFQHAVDGTDVEIHWRLANKYEYLKDDFNYIYSYYTQPFTMNGRQLLKLKSEAELLYIMTHGAAHGWFRLKWLVDVNDYLRNVPIDHGKLIELAKAHGLLRAVGFYNEMAAKMIPDPQLFPIGSKHVPRYLITYSRKRISDRPPRTFRYMSVNRKMIRIIENFTFSLLLTPSFRTLREMIRVQLNMVERKAAILKQNLGI